MLPAYLSKRVSCTPDLMCRKRMRKEVVDLGRLHSLCPGRSETSLTHVWQDFLDHQNPSGQGSIVRKVQWAVLVIWSPFGSSVQVYPSMVLSISECVKCASVLSC